MKLGLGPLENSRTFYSPKGNQTVIRDISVPQQNIPQPEPVKEAESVIEETIIDEPTLEIITEQPVLNTLKKTNGRSTKN
jgi:hypothetical protein